LETEWLFAGEHAAVCTAQASLAASPPMIHMSCMPCARIRFLQKLQSLENLILD
jgi:hypothetical protein